MKNSPDLLLPPPTHNLGDFPIAAARNYNTISVLHSRLQNHARLVIRLRLCRFMALCNTMHFCDLSLYIDSTRVGRDR